MPFLRPTLPELIDTTTSDFEGRLLGGAKSLRRSMIRIFSRVVAGASHLLHGHIQFNFKQIFPDTADSENLQRWAKIWGITVKPATFAAGDYIFSGVDTTVIPVDTLIQRVDGVQFKTSVPGTIAAGVAAVSVVAIVSGVGSNTDAGVILNLVSPIAGIDSQGTVDVDAIANGFDQETNSELLIRLLDRIQNPPLAGTLADYVFWAKLVPGVTRAFAFDNSAGPGTVELTFVLDNQVGTIIPNPAKVAEVQAQVDSLRPAGMDFFLAFAPTEVVQPFTISLVPDTAAIRTAVESELLDLFRREAIPEGVVFLSQKNEAISIATGEVDHTLIVPAADIVYAKNEVGTPGVFTFI